MDDVVAAISELCDVENKAACDFVGRKCGTCPKKKPEEIPAYLRNLMRIRNLQDVGRKIPSDVLSHQQWNDMLLIEQAINKHHREQIKAR